MVCDIPSIIYHSMGTISGKKVLVAMSGGVDSSVAAAMLCQQGYEVVGCFMRLGSEDSVESGDDDRCTSSTIKPGHQGCCSLLDASDARLVAAMLEIPFYVLNFRRDFDRIIRYFVDEYNEGRTPNPCVRCNDWLKFDKLMGYAESIDADFVATGHYAQIDHLAGGALLCGQDEHKDQSYFLFGVKRERLDKILLPIGSMQKSAVRHLAKQLGLPVFDKPDSQEICFVPDNNYASLIKQRTPDRVSEGDVLDTAGSVVGRHEGQQGFTIGQRRGVAVSLGHPVYVIDKDPVANTITIGTREELLVSGLEADQMNWLVDLPPEEPTDCCVKIRHNSKAVGARMHVTDHTTFRIEFNKPQQAVTPGQAVVCYQDNRVLGGGWITKSIR